ncbi:T-cell surface glycoprotein CD4-like [Pseudoliparis swirei]|uniref:T-cell surface glycoprotein CD4-like n=1 Tax=Pseudoliparis swirei TaxID=2059687 RepID=UPI0024BED5E1|nr:T-cell surface glycoprotein CD4-like [Pseudoliparis swirei]
MKTIAWFAFALAALSAAARVILTNPRHKATLECGVSSFTDILQWFHGEDLLHSVSGKSGIPRKGHFNVAGRSKVRSETTLEISDVKEEDAGKFVCNADGRREEHTLLVASVWASPSADLQLGSEATLHCKVSGLDRDSTVRWTSPAGSPHSGWLESVRRSDAGTWQCVFSQDGGVYSQNLAIEVQVPAPETTAPPSSPSPSTSCLDCVTRPPPSAAAPLLGLSWWVWLTAGGGCLAVVLLVVFVVVLCERIKRKRKHQVMKNGRQKPKSYCQCDCPAAAAKPQRGRRREKPSAPALQAAPLL